MITPRTKSEGLSWGISRHWLPLVTLCLLWASAWLVDTAWPTTLPFAPRQALRNLLLAIPLLTLATKRISRQPPRSSVRLALAGIALLGLPAALAEFASGTVSGVTASELFALLPAAVVVLAPYLTANSSASLRLLPPALLGLAGTLLLLPFALPDTWHQAALELLVLAGVLSATLASLWLPRLLAPFRVLEAAALCCAANAVFFLFLTPLNPGLASLTPHAILVEAATALLFDLPQILLLLWLIGAVPPERLAARYFLVPLFTVLEGIVLLRPETNWRTLAGAALTVAGIWRLTTASDAPEEPGLMLH